MFFSCLHSKSPHTSNQFPPLSRLCIQRVFRFLILIFMTWNVACARVVVLCLQAHFPLLLVHSWFLSVAALFSSPASFRIIIIIITIIILTFWECCRRGSGAERWAGFGESAHNSAGNVCAFYLQLQSNIFGRLDESLLAQRRGSGGGGHRLPEQEPPPSSAPPQPLQAGPYLPLHE